MGAIEHLKTLCCLGLEPESAMIAVVPLLHEIVPHGWTRLGLIDSNATITSYFGEHPESEALYRERLWRFMDDRSALCSWWLPMFRDVAIGMLLDKQGGAYLESGFYHEIEAPLDSCWVLDAMIGHGERTIGHVHLTRPRKAPPFTSRDVQRLDRIRPWLAHALRRSTAGLLQQDHSLLTNSSKHRVRSGQLIVTPDTRLVQQTGSSEFLLRILGGGPALSMRNLPMSGRDRLPTSVLKLLQRIIGAANGTSDMPPRAQVSTPYGIVTLEAQWLHPAGTLPADAARDPKSGLIVVTIELHEHGMAHAARALRKSGATPAQVKVGIQLAMGKSKPMIADELGLRMSSVVDVTKKLYENLDVHNSAELATKIWMGYPQGER